jgi:hypothetical protein
MAEDSKILGADLSNMDPDAKDWYVITRKRIMDETRFYQ